MKTYSMPYRGGASPPNRQGIVVCNMGRNRISEAECHKRLEGRPLRMVEYGGRVMSISTFECKVCGYVWKTTFDNVHRGKGCPRCAGNIKLDISDCREKLKNSESEILEYAGKSVSAKSVFKCRVCSYTWNATFNNVSRISGCPKCGGNARVSGEEARQRLSDRNIKVLKFVKGVLNKSVFKCGNCLHTWSSTFASVNHACGCPVCTKEVLTQLNRLGYIYSY